MGDVYENCYCMFDGVGNLASDPQSKQYYQQVLLWFQKVLPTNNPRPASR